jgi:uncharacterized membrane protein
MAGGRRHLGSVVAPPRFLAFLGAVAVGVPTGISLLGWREGMMAGFDLAAILFLLLYLPLLGYRADQMRAAAVRNDANRVLLLVVSAVVVLAVLVSVASELSQKGAPKTGAVSLIVATLALAWFFSNITYALHYAHIFYSDAAGDADGDGPDRGGLDFPKTDEPDYWDFIYFAFCLGMCFQTSDVDMTSGTMRRTATAHCLLAFIFNLGVLAFTINVLGGG